MFELYNPGAVLPGIVGGICLILAFYSFQTLPINYAGLLLILLGILLFVAEIKVQSYGLLTIGGAISLTLGSLLLYRTPASTLSISWGLIFSMTSATVFFFVFILGMAVKALKSPVQTGVESLVNEIGMAQTNLDPQGTVFIKGEFWNAVSEEPVSAHEKVVVVKVKDMVLEVKKYKSA
ncbi:MAG: hypothetical protein HYR79_05005 [Nitrospirae bacterium]|nr:hypothetical protein [Nitrospirota bacterium]